VPPDLVYTLLDKTSADYSYLTATSLPEDHPYVHRAACIAFDL